MKIKKYAFFLVIFVVIVAAITLGVVVPVHAAEGKRLSLKTIKADETGASSADKSQKGGSIFLEEGATFTMNGGTIENSRNTFGGAVYVSNKATFTMNGGTIQNCSAKYGGAIYIASGGKVIISGGKVLQNSAEVAPAIYVEQGGSLTVTNTSQVDGNIVGDWLPYETGPEERVGGTYSGTESTISLRTIYFGSYPQTYVGDTLNGELESWWTEDKPVVQTYTIRDQIWKSYLYTDGSIYARGNSKLYSSSGYTYKDSTAAKATGTTAWFKVEPIKWYIMNYDAWKAKTEDMELLSSLALTGYIRFNPTENSGSVWSGSELQGWLNEDFYKTAFKSSEQANIETTVNKNNSGQGDVSNSPETWTGVETKDKIYLLSYYDVTNGTFYSPTSGYSNRAATICSPTDFALSNNCHLDVSISSYYRDGVCNWWLRSKGMMDNIACYVDTSAYGPTTYGGLKNVHFAYYGIRPVLRLNI